MKYVFLLPLLLIHISVLSQWSNNPNIADNRLFRQTNRCIPAILPDNEGGTYVYSYHFDAASNLIYTVRRVNANGVGVWTNPPTFTIPLVSVYPFTIKPDNAGGLIVCHSLDGGTPEIPDAADIYLQRLDKNGNKLWGDTGVFIFKGITYNGTPLCDFCVNGDNIIAEWGYNEENTGRVTRLNAMSIGFNGIKKWAEPKNVVPEGETVYSMPNVMGTEQGGMMLFYAKGAFTPRNNFYVQKIDSAGNRLFEDTGKLVLPSVANINMRVLEDGPAQGDGFSVVYDHWPNSSGNNNDDHYAVLQYIDSNGNAVWANNGIRLQSASMMGKRFVQSFILKDRSNNTYAYLHTTTNGSTGQATTTSVIVQGQKVSPTGNLLWGSDGKQVLAGVRPGWIVADTAGNMLLPFCNLAANIKVKKLDTNGNDMWDTAGVPICLVPNFYDSIRSRDTLPSFTGVYVPGTGYVMAWSDYRIPVSTRYSCYVERLADDGQMKGNYTLCADGNTLLKANLTGTNYQWQVSVENGAFLNIADNANYSGTQTGSLTLSAIPSSWRGNQYRCIVDGTTGNSYGLAFKTTWKGTINSNWNEPQNWNCGKVPDAYTDVIINNGVVTLDAAGTCYSINVNPGVVFSVSATGVFTVTH